MALLREYTETPGLGVGESPRGDLRIPAVLTLAVLAGTFLYAWNQQYVLDWDACFRAFTGLAGRDLLVGMFRGAVRTRLDVIQVLTHYSDFFEARPGSLVSYPPAQTLLIGLLALISTQALFLSAFNAGMFALLSFGIWRLGRDLGLRLPGRLVAWAAVCLHPAILVTVWSLRRGLFEAAVVCWCLVWMGRLRRKPDGGAALTLAIAIFGGFLYRETLLLLAVPAVLIMRRHWREILRDMPAHRFRLAIATALVLVAGMFSAAQFGLAMAGRLSIFTKVSANVQSKGQPPPPGWLTLWGYYRGQFGPERFLGMDDAQLAAAGAPAIYRLARARWRLSVVRKTVYLASSVLANPVPGILILAGLIVWGWRQSRITRTDFEPLLAVTALYALMLCVLGGIPDYSTPILPGLGILAGRAAQGLPLREKLRFMPAWITVFVGLAVGSAALAGFASGRFEEYPPRYDYDRIATVLLANAPAGRVGVAIDNFLVKNLAFSKLRCDESNRLACVSMFGSRLPLRCLVGRKSYLRYSPLLKWRRIVPGVQWFVFRSATEQARMEESLADWGFQAPYWDTKYSRRVTGRKRLWGEFRPVYIRKLRTQRVEPAPSNIPGEKP